MLKSAAAEHLSHFLRMTSSSELNRDKVWMLLEYSLEAGSVGLLSNRLGGPKRGMRKELGERLRKLGAAISIARVLYRLMDTLTMVDWLNRLYSAPSASDEGAPSDDGSLSAVEKCQAWSLMLCAPLEAIWYLCFIGALKIRELRAGHIGMWSARFWSSFVFFQMLHALRARQILRCEEDTYLAHTAPLVTSTSAVSDDAPLSGASSDSGVGLDAHEREKASVEPRKEKREKSTISQAVSPTEFEKTMTDFALRRKDIRDGLGEAMGIFPLTLHWSVGETLFPAGSAYVGVLGSISAVFGIRKAWRDTA